MTGYVHVQVHINHGDNDPRVHRVGSMKMEELIDIMPPRLASQVP
jgi:hypothetical protein